MKASGNIPPATVATRRMELAMFLLLAVFLWPLIAVGVISAYGFAVWMGDVFFGPPPLL